MNIHRWVSDLFGEKPLHVWGNRILFILKKRCCYSGSYGNFSSGLYNSAKFCSDMLEENGYHTKLVEVTDNNDIDREVFQFRPDVCIIEALWVVPEKFIVLQELHPSVKWIVRIHSEAPFLSQEGIGIKWLSEYPNQNVWVGVNSLEAFEQLMSFYPDKGIDTEKLLYLPTYYPAPDIIKTRQFSGTTINIACMGAIRQLKNNLIQAIAAIRFADNKGYTLRFHINADIFDVEGSPTFKSLVDLFAGTKHQLIQHNWIDHNYFLLFLGTVDIGMQVSFSETFCIVAADVVATGTPFVGSPAIRWADEKSQADPTSIESIVKKLHNSLDNKKLCKDNLKMLQYYSSQAKRAWFETLEDF